MTNEVTSATPYLRDPSNETCEFRRDRSLAALALIGGIVFAALGAAIPTFHRVFCIAFSGYCFVSCLVYLLDTSVKLSFNSDGITAGSWIQKNVSWTQMKSISRLTVTKQASVREFLRIHNDQGRHIDFEISRLSQPADRVLQMFTEKYEQYSQVS